MSKAYWVFLGKEMSEHVKTFRLLILGAVFLLFGVMSPATAKFMPDILKMATGGSGLMINLPPVTVVDAYAQFFKNVGQIGVVVLLLVFAGAIAGEKSKGSAQLVLTKNLSRPAFLLAKFTGAALVWSAVYACSALACFGYAVWLFPGEAASNLLAAFATYWLFGVTLIALATLSSALAGGYGTAALGAFAGWGLLLISTIPAKIGKVSPAALGSLNVAVIVGATPATDLWIPVAAAVALTALALGLGCWALSKQEL